MTAPAARPGARSRQAKVVVTGPYGAGKTTFIHTMSEIAVLSTERRVSEAGVGAKHSTTVAMDFGRLTLDQDLSLLLFGTPGQRRFDFMWQILAEGMIGFVILVDAARTESYAEAAEILSFFTDVAEVPFVIAVNKGLEHPDGGVQEVREALDIPQGVRCLPVDAREKESARQVLLALLESALDEVEAQTAAVM